MKHYTQISWLGVGGLGLRLQFAIIQTLKRFHTLCNRVRPLQWPNSTARTHTCAETGEGKGALSEEVIARGIVMVLHHEANQSQVRDMDGEVEGAVPSWVKAWNRERPHAKTLIRTGFCAIGLARAVLCCARSASLPWRTSVAPSE